MNTNPNPTPAVEVAGPIPANQPVCPDCGDPLTDIHDDYILTLIGDIKTEAITPTFKAAQTAARNAGLTYDLIAALDFDSERAAVIFTLNNDDAPCGRAAAAVEQGIIEELETTSGWKYFWVERTRGYAEGQLEVLTQEWASDDDPIVEHLPPR